MRAEPKIVTLRTSRDGAKTRKASAISGIAERAILRSSGSRPPGEREHG